MWNSCKFPFWSNIHKSDVLVIAFAGSPWPSKVISNADTLLTLCEYTADNALLVLLFELSISIALSIIGLLPPPSTMYIGFIDISPSFITYSMSTKY